VPPGECGGGVRDPDQGTRPPYFPEKWYGPANLSKKKFSRNFSEPQRKKPEKIPATLFLPLMHQEPGRPGRSLRPTYPRIRFSSVPGSRPVTLNTPLPDDLTKSALIIFQNPVRALSLS